jgi:hypothetical protein
MYIGILQNKLGILFEFVEMIVDILSYKIEMFISIEFYIDENHQ